MPRKWKERGVRTLRQRTVLTMGVVGLAVVLQMVNRLQPVRGTVFGRPLG